MFLQNVYTEYLYRFSKQSFYTECVCTHSFYEHLRRMGLRTPFRAPLATEQARTAVLSAAVATQQARAGILSANEATEEARATISSATVNWFANLLMY